MSTKVKPIVLGVNIDHVATLRQARRSINPSVTRAAMDALDGGADYITIHLREDRRHIQDFDLVELLKKKYQYKFRDLPIGRNGGHCDQEQTRILLFSARKTRGAYNRRWARFNQ